MVPRKSIKQIIAEGRAELDGSDPFGEISEVTDRLEKVVEEVREVRQKQPSVPEIHVHTHARPSPPPESSGIEMSGPGGFNLKAKGAQVALVAALCAGIAGILWVLLH